MPVKDLSRRCDMCDSAPDAVVFLIDPKHSYGYTGTSRWTTSLWIAAKAIHTAVQRYEHTGCINHTDRSHIAVADRIFFERLFVRIFTRLLDRCCHLYLISLAAVYRKDFNENPLSRLELCAGVQKPLVTQFPEWNKRSTKMPARITDTILASAQTSL